MPIPVAEHIMRPFLLPTLLLLAGAPAFAQDPPPLAAGDPPARPVPAVAPPGHDPAAPPPAAAPVATDCNCGSATRVGGPR